jgi:hypothetical protein
MPSIELLDAVFGEVHGPPVRTAHIISRLGDRFPRAVIRGHKKRNVL